MTEQEAREILKSNNHVHHSVCRCQWATGFLDCYDTEVVKRDKEIEKLLAEAKEWLCLKCKTVYPGPPNPGFMCVICPKCCGNCGPKNWTELQAKQEEIEEQARLLGMSGEREADLLGKVDRLERELQAERERAKALVEVVDDFMCAMAPNFSDEEKKERCNRLKKAIAAYYFTKEGKEIVYGPLHMITCVKCNGDYVKGSMCPRC